MIQFFDFTKGQIKVQKGKLQKRDPLIMAELGQKLCLEFQLIHFLSLLSTGNKVRR